MDASVLTDVIHRAAFWAAIVGYVQAGEKGPAGVAFDDAMTFTAWPDPALKLYFNRPFRDAMEFVQRKGYTVNPGSWRNVWQEAHARAFTVAHVGQMDVLTDLRLHMEAALEEGTTLKQFKKELIPKLKAKGWWAEDTEKAWVELPDGTRRKRLMAHRLDIIYSTNISVANKVGEWKMFEETKETLPYLTYNCAFLPNSRDTHKRLHGNTWRKGDPALARVSPPSAWNCHCWLENADDSDLSEPIPRGDYADWDDPRNWTPRRRVDGLPDYAAEAIEEGWDFNPGAAGMHAYWPNAGKYEEKLWKKFEKLILDASMIYPMIKELLEEND